MLSEPTPTVPDAARALGVDVLQIIKSLVFLIDGEPILVIAAGEARISQKQLAEAFQVGKRKVRFASAEQALTLTGFEVGAMPPFGHKTQLSTLIDLQTVDAVHSNDSFIYGGGGTKSALLELSFKELKRVTRARLELLTEKEKK